MGRYDRKDRFYRQAKAEGRASRAFYKLEQIQNKYRVIKKGDCVVDLGCAPGGWLELASKLAGKEGVVLGVDLIEVDIKNSGNIKFFQGDVNDQETIRSITNELNSVDVVLSDMAPSTSGVKFRDSYLSYELALTALEVAEKILKPGGNFVVKIFPGEEFAGFKKELQKHFRGVVQYRPEATRKTSIEVYLVGTGFHPSTGLG